jgi:2Fe-2S ferredoxin
MSTLKVTLVERDGKEITIDDAGVGKSLMEVAKANGVDGILGECGGGCACATCHVYVDAQWQDVVGPPDVLEEMTLDGVSHITRDNSRLGCQILLSKEMDGLRVAVAPPQ